MEDYADKTEQPTQRRLEEARREGRVARSAELSAALVLLTAIIAMKQVAPALVEAIRSLMISSMSFQTPDFKQIANALLPLLIAVVVAALVVNLLQVGIRLQFRPRGLKRSRRPGFAPIATAAIRATIVIAVAFTTMQPRLANLLALPQLTFPATLTLSASLLFAVITRVLIAAVTLGLLDYAWQRIKLHRSLRMTKREVQDELRQTEGDPKLKSRRRQLATMFFNGRIDRVKEACLVVTAADCAVALEYDAQKDTAPRVLVKARGLRMKSMHQLATAAGVTIVEQATIAKQATRLAVGQELPEALLGDAAELFARTEVA